MSMEFVRLTSGELIEFKDRHDRPALWIRVSEIKSVSPHYRSETWAGRTYVTEDGAYIEYGNGHSAFVAERPAAVMALIQPEAA